VLTDILDKVVVVKIGGATFGSNDTTIEDVVYLQLQGIKLIVVHGGANVVTKWLDKQGIPTHFINGERVTDKSSLDMVTAVLGGLVNKEIVASINSQGGRAVGICGIDGALVNSRIRGREMGYVGTIVEVNLALIETLLESGFIPVISPLALHSVDRPEGAPLSLNVNGDTLAGEIAAAAGAQSLILLTDVAGIFDHSGKLLSRLSPEEAETLLASGVASKGMVVKLRACLRALSNIASARIIDGRQPHALRREIEGVGEGTTVGELE
jgi:acetylglutamate kinase